MQDYERDNILEQYEIAVNSTRKTRECHFMHR